MTHRRQPNARSGFTLVELIIVTAIIGLLAALGTYAYLSIVNKARIVQAIGDIRAISMAVDDYWVVNQAYPPNLAAVFEDDRVDPWGHPYEYIPIASAKGKYRKDKNLHPINTDYDLYSMGADGKSNLALTAQASQDDVVRANNGGFLGLAANY